MTNSEIADLLRKIAAVYELENESRFRIIAYDRAADVIEKSATEMQSLWHEGKLRQVGGIGKSLASHLDELFRTGGVKHFDQVLSKYPSSMFPLLKVPGIGAKKAYKLVTQLKLNDPKTIIDDLTIKGQEGKISILENFGKKSEEDIVNALLKFKKSGQKSTRMPLPYAFDIASDILAYLQNNPAVKEAQVLGSLRRMVSTIGDIDIAVSTNQPENIVEWFINYPGKADIVEKGPEGATISLANNKQIDLRVQSPEKYGAMLQYFTGSKNHNITLREYAIKKGYSLSEYGIKPLKDKKNTKAANFDKSSGLYQFKDEVSFYNFIGLPYIPPEIREDTGEIQLAVKNKLPKLVTIDDIKGEFHVHSDYNLEPSHDLGRSPLNELLKNASGLDYQYLGISDHNPSSSRHSSEDIISILKRRKEVFDKIISSTKFTRVNLLVMLEIDILPDGNLPLPTEAFRYLDAAIVSVHSSFGMEKEHMTDRIIKGLSHPKCKILGHPTGRILGKRTGYEIDWQRLFKFCRENDKALEIDAYPDRLDLSDIMVRQAIDAGVKLVIDSDSHEAAQLENLKFGVAVARRGWAASSDIINTMPYNKVKEWLTSS